MATKYDYFEGDPGVTDDSRRIGTLDIRYGQTFTTSAEYYATSVKFHCGYRVGSIGTVTASIRAADENDHPVGSDLATGTRNGNDILAAPDYDWIEFTFNSPVKLATNTKYAVIIRADGVEYTSKYFYVSCEDPAYYTNGKAVQSTDGGNTWTVSETRDFFFQVWGESNLTPIDKTYSKRLIAIGSNEVWYESSLGVMAELTAANNDIDTFLPLTATEALQKIFIANKSNLKVLDFVNTKISTSDVGANPPTKGMLLTGGTSNATMIVDYADSVTDGAAANIYGYKTSIAAFVSGETVSGKNKNGDTVSFVLFAGESSAPHWYSWTPFGNDTSTYGLMPSQATLVCTYRGRLVLAGNSDYPHQWYMSRTINPWDWQYVVNDPLTPIRGGNADAGQVGDIIKALIPYRDDYLIFGCANSIWLMRGDPAAGGSLDPVTDKTGIYGPRAWCFDDMGVLYFFGDGGLYRISSGSGIATPENISQAALPNWIKNWALNEENHRVVLSFDPIRKGILISKTNLSDGVNENYYYDIKIGGFYPESYPSSCGIFSSYYYASTDNDYKKMLYGCSDGYIREFIDSAKNDDSGTSDTAISSYLVYPTIKMHQEDDKEGKLISLTFEVAGGNSNGSFNDSDGFTYSLYRADDAETLIENIKDGDTPFATGSISATGRQGRIRTRVRGRWLGIKISNSNSSETWSINLINGQIIPAGKIKG